MHTAICAFDARARAEQAVDGLVRAGFARHDVHIEHRDGDRGVLASVGHFFAGLLGRDRDPARAEAYAQHVEQGRYVVVVDADDEAGARRALAMLTEMHGDAAEVVHRAGQRRLRDLVGIRDEPAGMVERSREAYEGWANDPAVERERALASHRLEARTGPDLRAPDVGRAPGPGPADPDKPNR